MKTESQAGFPTIGTPTQGLTGATLGFFIGFAAVSLFGPTAKGLKGILGLTPLEVGFLVAAPSLSGSLLRIPFSAWVDTTGGKKPFLVLLLLSIIGMAGLFLTLRSYYPARMTPSFYPLILLLGVLCGCGIATFSVGIGQVAYWFPKGPAGDGAGHLRRDRKPRSRDLHAPPPPCAGNHGPYLVLSGLAHIPCRGGRLVRGHRPECLVLPDDGTGSDCR